jgi:hypothetical protein
MFRYNVLLFDIINTSRAIKILDDLYSFNLDQWVASRVQFLSDPSDTAARDLADEWRRSADAVAGDLVDMIKQYDDKVVEFSRLESFLKDMDESGYLTPTERDRLQDRPNIPYFESPVDRRFGPPYQPIVV